MENMRMTELKALAKEHRLRGYSRLRKAELIGRIQNNQQPFKVGSPIGLLSQIDLHHLHQLKLGNLHMIGLDPN